MNCTIFCGNIVRDVELRYSSSGTEFLSNTIAVARNFKNAEGDYDTDFINFKAFGSKAKYIAYAKKGERILIKGRLQTGSYQTEAGETRYTAEVIVDEARLLSPAKSKEPTMDTDKKVEQPDIYADFGDEVVIDDNFLD